MAVHVLSKENPAFRRLVDTLATAERLTVITGAGVSMDAGLPKWKTLVQTFLEDGFREAQADGRVGSSHKAADLAKYLVENQEVLSAAAVGRYLHGEQRDAHLQDALYSGHPKRPRPGRIALALTSLARAYGNKMRIITTNFDDVLEFAIRSTGDLRLTIRTVGDEGLEDVDDGMENGGSESLVSTHIHGYAPFGDRTYGSLVLDDSDFALSKARPPGEILPDLLTTEPTLFLGLSMTDPNLVSASYMVTQEIEPAELPWFGLFVGEAGDLPQALNRYLFQRLRLMGIKPLELQSYGQISQVLYEVLHRQSLGDEYWSDATHHRYGRRFTAWRAALDAKYPHIFGGDQFGDEHRTLHDALADLMAEIRRDILSEVSQDEHLALHLWVRKPGSTLGELELWGSSAHIHREWWSLRAQTLPVRNGTGVPAVDAVYFAAVQRRDMAAIPGSRWENMIAVPILLDGDQSYPDLVVGCITLSSTEPMGSSVIPGRYQDLVDPVHRFGQKWLDPETA